MAFTKPIFNLLCDIWNVPHVPSMDPADSVDVPCQVYVHSRADIDQLQTSSDQWVPPIYIRAATAAPIFQRGQIILPHDFGADYYKVRWIQLVHMGFTNQYLAVLVEQCNADGTTPRTY